MPTKRVFIEVKKPCHVVVQCEACDHTFEFHTQIADSAQEMMRSSLFGSNRAQATSTARANAQSGLHGKLARLSSGDLTVIDGKKACPSCGYTQSWMVTNEFQMIVKAMLVFFGGWAIVIILGGFLLGQVDHSGPWFTYALWLGTACLIVGTSVIVYSKVMHPNRTWLKQNGKTTRNLPAPRKPLRIIV